MINIFLNRIFRAIKIDIDLFEEVEKDKNATFQAGIVVVLSSLAAGVGSLHLGASNFLIAPALSCLLYTSPSPRDLSTPRMPSSA